MEGLSFFLDLMDVASLLFDATAWLLRKLLKPGRRSADQWSVRADYVGETGAKNVGVAGFRDPLIFGRFSDCDLILRSSLPSDEYSRRLHRRIARRRQQRASSH